jgi:hypothetical protein
MGGAAVLGGALPRVAEPFRRRSTDRHAPPAVATRLPLDRNREDTLVRSRLRMLDLPGVRHRRNASCLSSPTRRHPCRRCERQSKARMPREWFPARAAPPSPVPTTGSQLRNGCPFESIRPVLILGVGKILGALTGGPRASKLRVHPRGGVGLSGEPKPSLPPQESKLLGKRPTSRAWGCGGRLARGSLNHSRGGPTRNLALSAFGLHLACYSS